MDDLARGWAIVWSHMHGHGNLAVWIAIFLAMWIAIGIAVHEKKGKKTDDGDFRPIKRTPVQGSEKDFRPPPP